MIYWQSARFLAPLVLTAIVARLGGQFLNGGMTRIAAIPVTLLFSLIDVHGATRGVTLLLCGFAIETFTAWLGVRGPWRRT